MEENGRSCWSLDGIVQCYSFNSEELLTLVVFFVKHCSHPNDDVSIQNPSKNLRRMPFI